MMNELDLSDEMVQDGLAFARFMEDERQQAALAKLLAQLNADAISRWESDDDGKWSKKWLRGYREALGDVQMRIGQKAQDAAAYVEAKRGGEEQIGLMGDDGKGSGDLAIA